VTRRARERESRAAIGHARPHDTANASHLVNPKAVLSCGRWRAERDAEIRRKLRGETGESQFAQCQQGFTVIRIR
jgi:hypothetical protein